MQILLTGIALHAGDLFVGTPLGSARSPCKLACPAASQAPF